MLTGDFRNTCIVANSELQPPWKFFHYRNVEELLIGIGGNELQVEMFQISALRYDSPIH
jgi:hypothetical protein